MVEKSYKFILIGAALVFTGLFLYQTTNAYRHEELIATKIFYQYSPFNQSPDGFLKDSMLDFSRNWRNYFRIYPPGFVIFYSLWSKVADNIEVLMRLPLFILALFSLFKFYSYLSNLYSHKEASYYILLLSFAPIWYAQGVILRPESFSLFFSVLSFCLFHEAFILKKEKSYRWLLFTNSFWICFSYFSLLACATQFLFAYFVKNNIRSQSRGLLYLLFMGTSLYLVIYFFITGEQTSNLYMLKWKKPELTQFFTILHLLVTGRANE